MRTRDECPRDFRRLATKADLDKAEASLTMRTIAIVGALDALLFTLLKLT